MMVSEYSNRNVKTLKLMTKLNYLFQLKVNIKLILN